MLPSVAVLALSIIHGFIHLNTIQWDSIALPPIELFSINGHEATCILHENDTTQIVSGKSCGLRAPLTDEIYMTFRLRSKEIVVHASNNRFLCISRNFSFVAVGDSKFVNEQRNILDEVIPMRETIYFDAYILTDWKLLSRIIHEDIDWSSTVCAGIATLFHQENNPSNDSVRKSMLLTMPTSINRGSPASLHYWDHRCEWPATAKTQSCYNESVGSTINRIYVAELWHLSDEIFLRMNDNFSPFEDAHLWPLSQSSVEYMPTSPCILQETYSFDRDSGVINNDINMEGFDSPCVEELFSKIGEFTYVSTVGLSLMAGDAQYANSVDIDAEIEQSVNHLLFVMLTYQNMKIFQELDTTRHHILFDAEEENEDTRGLRIISLLRDVAKKSEIRYSDFLQATSFAAPEMRCDFSVDGAWTRTYADMHSVASSLTTLISATTEEEWQSHMNSLAVVFVVSSCVGEAFQPNEQIDGVDNSTSYADHALHTYRRSSLLQELMEKILHIFLPFVHIDVKNAMHWQLQCTCEEDTVCDSFIFHSHSARQQLISILKSLSGTNSAVRFVNISEEEVGTMARLRPLLDMLSVNSTHLCENDDNPSIHCNNSHNEQVLQPNRIPLISSSFQTHVIITVLSRDLKAARRITETFYRITHPINIYYHIQVIPPSNEYRGNSSWCLECPGDQILPSLRGSLLFAQQVIDRFATNRDMAAVLIGIEALRSVVAPKSVDHTIGLFINGMELEAHGIRNMPELLFAAAAVSNRKNSGFGMRVDIRAVFGVAYEVKNMFISVKSSPYQGISDAVLGNAIRHFIHTSQCQHAQTELPRVVVGIDSSKEIFNMDLASSIPIDREFLCESHTFKEKNETNYILDELAISPNFDTNRLRGLYESINTLVLSGEIAAIVRSHVDLTLALNHFEADILYTRFYFMLSRMMHGGYTTRLISLNERLHTMDMLENEVLPIYWDKVKNFLVYDGSGAFSASMGMSQPQAARELLSIIHFTIGNTLLASKWYQMSRFPPVHAEWKDLSLQWQQQQRELSRDDQGDIKTWYMTYATDTEKLAPLQLSADIAGITLTVAGLGSKFESFYDKTQAFATKLNADRQFHDNDCIVIVDGYDVIFTPAIRRACEILAKSSTPIIFGVELGGYPTNQGAWTNLGMKTELFKQSRVDPRDLFPRYLNSGLLMGRVGQIKELFRKVMASNLAMMFIDDQHMMNAIAHRHSSLISLDYDSKVFFNAFGVASSDVSFDKHFALVWRNSHLDNVRERRDVEGRVLCAAAIHCSGSTGKLIYKSLVAQMYSRCANSSNSQAEGRFEQNVWIEQEKQPQTSWCSKHSSSDAVNREKLEVVREWWAKHCLP